MLCGHCEKNCSRFWMWLLHETLGYYKAVLMVGQLVPARWQSLCMGSILLNSGVAAVLASYFSNYALDTSGSSNPLITNPSYSHSFNQLGWVTLGIAMILFLLTPVLNRLRNSLRAILVEMILYLVLIHMGNHCQQK